MGRRRLKDQMESAEKHRDDEPQFLPPVLQRRPGRLAPADATGRKRPAYPSETDRVKATYDLDETIIERVREIAVKDARIGNRPSKVARALLVYALDAYEAGRFSLEVENRGPEWWLEAVEK